MNENKLPYFEENKQQIIQGDCLEVMRSMKANSISCIVTDPPYGLHFMGKDWDKFNKTNFDEKSTRKCVPSGNEKIGPIYNANSVSGTYNERLNDEFQEFMKEFGREALRIVKPDGHLLMFGAPRRFYRQACGLEDAGWEIRDTMCWLFGQGFPKSHNFGRKLGDDWSGYGTALKPAWEPILVCMKPCDGTFAQNAEKWGQAGINIDACRVGTDDTRSPTYSMTSRGISGGGFATGKMDYSRDGKIAGSSCGRWPANLLLDEEAAAQLDEMSGISKSSSHMRYNKNSIFNNKNEKSTKGVADSGGASRFFYCAKASSNERNSGLDGMPLKQSNPNFGSGGFSRPTDQPERETKPSANHHPTVKPLKLMEYLIKLVMPPADGLLLDPFAGSGSTIVAATSLGYNAIGIEMSTDYCEIARARIAHAIQERDALPEQMELGLYE